MLRKTNYQHRYSAFRDKPERRAMSQKYLEDELDAIVRQIMHLAEKSCFTCGSVKELQVGHLVERRHRHTRWDSHETGAVHLQCGPCNALHESKPEKYISMFTIRFGERAYADVQERAHSRQKLTYTDLLSLLEEKEKQLKELKERSNHAAQHNHRNRSTSAESCGPSEGAEPRRIRILS